MKCALVGSRFFAASVFEALRKEEGIEFTCIVAPAEDDRLAIAGRAAGVPVHVLANPRMVPGEAIAEGTDIILAAHTHARVSDEALAQIPDTLLEPILGVAFVLDSIVRSARCASWTASRPSRWKTRRAWRAESRRCGTPPPP